MDQFTPVSRDQRYRARQAEKVRRMREACEYYADPARWQLNSAGITPAMDDRGYKAREALK